MELSLKEWLKNNKHVTTVTRDCASAYAKAVEEVLPDCMQIADRFRLHQNLLEAIKNTLNATVPVDIKIPTDYGSASGQPAQNTTGSRKKTPDDVNNFSACNSRSVQLYNSIHKYAEAGYRKREIAQIVHCGRNTVAKYLNGDYESLCRKDFRSVWINFMTISSRNSLLV